MLPPLARPDADFLPLSLALEVEVVLGVLRQPLGIHPGVTHLQQVAEVMSGTSRPVNRATKDPPIWLTRSHGTYPVSLPEATNAIRVVEKVMSPSGGKPMRFAMIYRPGPAFAPELSPTTPGVLRDHVELMHRISDEGGMLLGGPFTDGPGGMSIVDR